MPEQLCMARSRGDWIRTDVANTRYLREVVEAYVRGELEREYGFPFSSTVLPVSPGGTHEFDAVSADRSVIASIKSASGLTASGKHPSGKIKDCIAELYYLSLVQAESRLLVLTSPSFYEIFMRAMIGRVDKGIAVRCIPLPADIQTEVDRIVAEASREVSPAKRRAAIASEIELEIEDGGSHES